MCVLFLDFSLSLSILINFSYLFYVNPLADHNVIIIIRLPKPLDSRVWRFPFKIALNMQSLNVPIYSLQYSIQYRLFDFQKSFTACGLYEICFNFSSSTTSYIRPFDIWDLFFY